MYDETNGQIMFFDGTNWKPIGGGVEKETTKESVTNPEEGKVYYMDSEGKYYVYEDGVWLVLAKTWEGTQAQYEALGSGWSVAHPDVIIFVTD